MHTASEARKTARAGGALNTRGAAVDDVTYEVLSWMAAGNSVFRPRGLTLEDQEAFRGVMALLGRFRDGHLVDYLEGHVTKRGQGQYLMVGPVLLTHTGKSALERDRRLGARPPRSGEVLPWRT